MSQPLDYKELLKKYMRHVRDCEGIDFTNSLDEGYGLSLEEIEILQGISNEVSDE